MKRGQKVFICHDGKYSRRVDGVVVEQRNGHHIKVRFESPADDSDIEVWFRKDAAIRYLKRSGCISWSKRPARFSGWADIEYFCPWFTVRKWSAP